MVQADLFAVWFSCLLFRSCLETFCLSGNEFGVIEVVDLHGAAYFVEGLCCHGACIFCTAAQDVVYGRDVLFPFCTALADGFEACVENIIEEFLAGAVA